MLVRRRARARARAAEQPGPIGIEGFDLHVDRCRTVRLHGDGVDQRPEPPAWLAVHAGGGASAGAAAVSVVKVWRSILLPPDRAAGRALPGLMPIKVSGGKRRGWSSDTDVGACGLPGASKIEKDEGTMDG
jgi:hypothetical protein